MQKRFEEGAYRRLLGAVESHTGRTFSAEEMGLLTRGAGEADLVSSGLEETMCNAYGQIRDLRLRYDGRATLRDAAFINAIDKIVLSYQDLGIFP